MLNKEGRMIENVRSSLRGDENDRIEHSTYSTGTGRMHLCSLRVVSNKLVIIFYNLCTTLLNTSLSQNIGKQSYNLSFSGIVIFVHFYSGRPQTGHNGQPGVYCVEFGA